MRFGSGILINLRINEVTAEELESELGNEPEFRRFLGRSTDSANGGKVNI